MKLKDKKNFVETDPQLVPTLLGVQGLFSDG
jgi:hypothetical protein